MQDLANTHTVPDLVTCNQMLLQARQPLGQLNACYQQELTGAEELSIAMAYEDLFCVTALAQVRNHSHREGTGESAAHPDVTTFAAG